MQVRLSSQEREILDHGTVFLFDANADLTFNITSEDSFEFLLTINFVEDIYGTRRIEKTISENCIKITCTNFSAEGTGLAVPMELAVINGKKIYFMFWAYLEGTEEKKTKARKVEYTLYSEK
ncbi:MAG: DUF6864 domain-containing function [Lachnospiraceae bacterium]